MTKIFNSLLVIGAVIAVVGTAACFMGDRIGVTFSDAKLILKIRDQDEGYKKGGVVGTWTAENMLPGDGWTFDESFVRLFNAGGISGDHLEITCDYAVADTCDQSDPNWLESDTDCETDSKSDEMAKEMIITKSVYYRRKTGNDAGFCVDALSGKKFLFFSPLGRFCFGAPSDENSDWKIEDQDGDGKITFSDLKSDKLDNLPPPNKKTFYIMDIMFASDAGNDFQGDTFDLTMSFTSNEDASQ